MFPSLLKHRHQAGIRTQALEQGAGGFEIAEADRVTDRLALGANGGMLLEVFTREGTGIPAQGDRQGIPGQRCAAAGEM